MTVDPGLLQPGGERVQRGGVRDLPAEEARALRHRAVDDDALLAVVHPERQQRGAALHRLQADQAGAELPPVVERGRAEPGIAQSLQHRAPPVPCVWPNLRIFSAFGTEASRPGPANRPVAARVTLTSPPRHGVYTAMSTAVRNTRLWWRTS